jgi:hypothetical protein
MGLKGRQGNKSFFCRTELTEENVLTGESSLRLDQGNVERRFPNPMFERRIRRLILQGDRSSRRR